jgi:pyrimidine deaminase RibD-like protein
MSEFMRLAIEETKKLKQEKEPPLYVGAVVAKDKKLLAKAHRGEIPQGDHAEYTLLERKLRDVDITGATLYTTLEPCTTRKHPKAPCAVRT